MICKQTQAGLMKMVGVPLGGHCHTTNMCGMTHTHTYILNVIKRILKGWQDGSVSDKGLLHNYKDQSLDLSTHTRSQASLKMPSWSPSSKKDKLLLVRYFDGSKEDSNYYNCFMSPYVLSLFHHGTQWTWCNIWGSLM